MKKLAARVFFLALVFNAMLMYAHAAEPHEVVSYYLGALQQGDVDGLKKVLGGKLYEEKKTLLESNTDYPRFLKELYKDAAFQVSEPVEGEENVIVDIEVRYPDGNSVVGRLLLAKDENGNWKIVDEI